MGVRITWEGGGHGEVTRVDGLHVTVGSSRAFPPGEPARGSLLADDGTRTFTLKVAGSRRDGQDGDGHDRFEVRGRLVNATVDVRAAFARAVVASGVP